MKGEKECIALEVLEVFCCVGFLGNKLAQRNNEFFVVIFIVMQVRDLNKLLR